MKSLWCAYVWVSVFDMHCFITINWNIRKIGTHFCVCWEMFSWYLFCLVLFFGFFFWDWDVNKCFKLDVAVPPILFCALHVLDPIFGFHIHTFARSTLCRFPSIRLFLFLWTHKHIQKFFWNSIANIGCWMSLMQMVKEVYRCSHEFIQNERKIVIFQYKEKIMRIK